MIKCKNTDKNKLRRRDRNSNKFNGPGFCLINEEFNDESCFNNTLADKL